MDYRIGQRVRAKKTIRGEDKDGNRIIVALAGDEGAIVSVVTEGRSFMVLFDPTDADLVGLNPSKGNFVQVARSHLDLVVSSLPSRESSLSQAVRMLENFEKFTQYPWSCLSARQMKTLLTHGTTSEAVEETLSFEDYGDEHLAMAKLFHATAVWGRGPRRLVRVSKKAQEVLCDLAGERAAQGFRICYWHFLSAMGATSGNNDEVGFGEGVMFVWEDDEQDIITFGAPRGVFGDEYLEYGAFTWSSEDQCWAIGRMPLFLKGQDYEDKFAESVAETEKTGATRVEAIAALLYSDYFRMVHMTVNLLHALHNFTPLVCEPKQRAERRREEKEVAKDRNGCGKVVSINIEDDGLSTWSETWCYEELDREEQRIQLGKQTRFGSPVGAHQRKGHMWRPWIAPENIRKSEKILDKKRRKKADGTYSELWQVKRARQGCWVPGSGAIKPKISRVKSGPDDLDVRKMPKPKTPPKTILRKTGGK